MPRLKVLAVLATAAALGAPAAQAENGRHFNHRTVTVMTQNLYLGTDLSPVIRARGRDELAAAVERAMRSLTIAPVGIVICLT